MNTISLRLKQIRREKNMSQEELARQLGISRQAIIALEQGTSLPSLPVLMALLRVLDIPFTKLFEDNWTPFRQFDPENEPEQSGTLATYRHGQGSQNIPITLHEDSTNIYVTAELAGVADEDVTVDLSPQHLLVMAIRRPCFGNDVNARITELTFGPLMRIISLPYPINTNQARAEFTRGMLYLTLPKLVPETKRRITFPSNESRD